MAINNTGALYGIIQNLSIYVFGNEIVTTIVMTLFFVLFAVMIQIPLPFAIALQIPLIIILTAWGYLPVVVGVVLTSVYLIIAAGSFLARMMN